MGRIYKFLLLILISHASFAQDIKVYNSYQLGSSLGQYSNSVRFSLGEILEFEKKAKFKIITDLQYEGIYTKSGIAKPIDSKIKSNLTVNKSFFQSRLSIPIGLELEFNKVVFGISQEIVNFNFRKSLDSTYFTPKTYSQIKPQSATFLFTKNNSLSSKIYVGYSPSSVLTVLFGLNKEKNLLILSDNQDLKIGKSFMGQIQPYITIRFNVEK